MKELALKYFKEPISFFSILFIIANVEDICNLIGQTSPLIRTPIVKELTLKYFKEPISFFFQYCSLLLTCKISTIWLVKRNTIAAVLYSWSKQMLQNTESYWNKGGYFHKIVSQETITCSKSTIKTKEKICEVCSKITKKTPERSQCRRSVFIVNFKHSSHLFVVFYWCFGQACNFLR